MTAVAQQILRPYQSESIAALCTAFADYRRVVFVSPTGSGKTIVAGALIEDAGPAWRSRVLVLAHRREIIGQTSAKLFAAGVPHGIIQAGYPTRPDALVQVASIATLHFPRGPARGDRTAARRGLVAIDRRMRHRARAPSYLALLRRYPKAAIIGMTATTMPGAMAAVSAPSSTRLSTVRRPRT